MLTRKIGVELLLATLPPLLSTIISSINLLSIFKNVLTSTNTLVFSARVPTVPE